MVYCITDPGILATDGFQAGDFILRIDGQEVNKVLIAAASSPPASIKLYYYRPGNNDEGEVEVPGIGNASGFMGLGLSQPGPLASRGVSRWDVVSHINEESVSPELFIDLADDPEGQATTLIYRDFTFAVRTLSLG